MVDLLLAIGLELGFAVFVEGDKTVVWCDNCGVWFVGLDGGFLVIRSIRVSGVGFEFTRDVFSVGDPELLSCLRDWFVKYCDV